MGLEASDLSDGAILESTQQFQNGNGQVQFKITLPSGRELESEWLSPDMKKKAMVSWLDVVKDQAILDADQARAEAREVAMKQRRDALEASTQETDMATSPAPGQSLHTTGSQSPSPVTAPVVGYTAVNGAAPSASPDAYVAAGLTAAEADYTHWNAVAIDAMERALKARENIYKWTNIKRSLEGHEQSSSVNRSSDTRTSGSGNNSPPVRKRRKRTVAKSTDFKEPKSLEGQYDAI